MLPDLARHCVGGWLRGSQETEACSSQWASRKELTLASRKIFLRLFPKMRWCRPDGFINPKLMAERTWMDVISGRQCTELLKGVAWKMGEPLVMAQTWPVCRKGPLRSDHSTAPPWGPHVSCCNFIYMLSRSVTANRTVKSEKTRTSPWSPRCALLDTICKTRHGRSLATWGYRLLSGGKLVCE